MKIKSQILTAVGAAFLGGILLAFGVTQFVGSSDSVAPAAAATAAASGSSTVSSTSVLTAADIYASVRPSVVQINVTAVETSGRRRQTVSGTGTGIVIDSSGDILTNFHVIDAATQIEVVFDDGSSVSGTVAGSDEAKDIAVVKVDPSAHELTPAKLGNSEDLRVGDSVLAIGNPFDLSGTLTQGIVSALDRSFDESNTVTLHDLIQTDASVNPGNSGGPMLNNQGEVVGINTLIENPTGQSVNVGVAFAVSINTVTAELSTLTG
ncbi:MAG: trypsin-like peptidase domain-containing protein [Chloroflexota bacterium]